MLGEYDKCTECNSRGVWINNLCDDCSNDYTESITKALAKFPPTKTGGCYQATRWLMEQHPELKEEVVSIKNGEGDIKHCIAVTPEGKIIDTQHFQFGLVIELPKGFDDVYIFTREEHEKFLPRWRWD